MWTKSKDDWTARLGELVLFVKPKADGRWTWEVYKEGAPNPMASGVANSANQAKRNSENFAQRGPLKV